MMTESIVQAERKIDCHCHIFDPKRFAYNPASPFHPTGQEIATSAQIGRVFDAHNVGHGLLVQPNSGYADDNRCMLDAIAQSGGRYKGIAVVAHDTSLERLAELKRLGIVGVAFNLPFFEPGYYAGTEPLLERLRALDLFLQIQVEADGLLGIWPLLEASGVRLLVDHCGRPRPEHGVQQQGFHALLDLGRRKRAVVKLSGHIKFSNRSHPFEDVSPFMEALIDAFGPDGCVWGSDWPFLRAPERVDYGPLLDLFGAVVPDPAMRRKILWDTPNRLFGFDQVRA